MSEKLEKGMKGGFESLKNIKSIDEFDLGNIELTKGQTPKDIEEKCLQLCKDYLSGDWCQQTVDTIEVRRITGGLTNQMFYCGMLQKTQSESVPQEVAIRLYGPKYFDPNKNESNDRMSDMIIGLVASQHSIGPKVYGIFEGGIILKYYQHRIFQNKEQNDPVLVRKMISKLAEIHLLNVPIKKTGDWTDRVLLELYNEAYSKFNIQDEIDEYNCETLKKYDLKNEFEWFHGIVQKLKSPVVFSHNDFRSSNLLITESNEEMIICDFDISCYGYRGYDFTSLMREWGRNIWDFKSIEGLPPKDSVFRPLIEMYVEECVKINGNSFIGNEINSVDHILKEVKTFYLFYLLFGVMFFLKNEENSDGFPFGRNISMQFAELNFKNYFTMKDILKEQKIID